MSEDITSSGSDIVDMMANFAPEGNIIHHEWFRTVTKTKGKADLLAINILADVVYWYRPTVTRSESTGLIVEYKKKFQNDLLQRTYDSYSRQFGVSKRQVQEAMYRLEKLGVIKKELRNIKTEQGLFLSNVLYIKLDFDTLQKISSPSHEKTYDLPRKKVGTIPQKEGTYTETTTKTTTETNNNQNHNGAIFEQNRTSSFSLESRQTVSMYLTYYLRRTRQKHPALKTEQINRVLNEIDTFMTDNSIDIDGMEEMIRQHFNRNMDTDYNINHFATEGVLTNLLYESALY